MTTADKWVLLVEDNPDDELLAKRAFRSCERPERIRVAREGAEAREALREDSPPCLVLLDIKLPKVSGLEVLAWARTQERLANVPIIMLTSSDDEDDLRKSFNLGANAFVKKPVDYDAFMTTFRCLMDFWMNPHVLIPGRVLV